MEAKVEKRERHPVRRWALLTASGLVALGLITVLFAHESTKGGEGEMTKGAETAAEERAAPPPSMDAARPGAIETATFALG